MKNSRHLISSLLLFLVLGISATAQNAYVSKSIADVIKTGKFYMKMSGTQADDDYDEEDEAPMNIRFQQELAFKGKASMTRSKTGSMEIVSLSSDRYNYMLDEQSKSWTAQGPSMIPAYASIRFVRQGSCKVNGKDGWYYDQYRTPEGMEFTFYYNTDKVSVVEMGFPEEDEDDAMGPMNLVSFSGYIPSNMYFCLGTGWKKSSGGSSMGMAMTPELEKQIREQMKNVDLPAGMSVDDLIKQAMGGSSRAASSTPAPPSCTTPWKDTGSQVELAFNQSFPTIVITDKRPVSKPVYASDMAKAESSAVTAGGYLREDINITAEGIRKAFDIIEKDIEGMTDKQIAEYVMNYSNEVSKSAFAGIVTGDMIEMAIARSQIYPHPAMLQTTGELLICAGRPKNALEYFEAAEEIEPNIIIEYGILECLIEMENFAKARTVIPKIIELQPDGVPEDGQVYQYRAMLELEDGDYQAATDDLFKSMSLGYFDEESATMLSSLLDQLDAAAIATLDNADFIHVINKVFSEKNLAALRKSITYELGDDYAVDNSRDFGWPYSVNAVESIYPSLQATYDKVDTKRERNSITASASMKEVINEYMLYFSMGNMTGPVNSENLEEHIDNTDYGHNAIEMLKARMPDDNYVGKYRKYLDKINDAGMSMFDRGYKTFSDVLKMQYDVDGLILDDALSFWALYTLNRYHQYRMMYLDGGLAYEVDLDEDGFADRIDGNCPSDVRTYLLNIASENRRYAKEYEHLVEQWNKIDEDFIPKDEIEYYKHLISRAEAFLAIKKPHEIKILEFKRDHYARNISEELEYWWYDMGKYGQYPFSTELCAYFQCTAFENIYERYSEIFSEGAGVGAELAQDQEEIDHLYGQIGEVKRKIQEAKDAALVAKIQEEADEELQGKNGESGLSDLTVKIPTPMGDFEFGMMDSKFGWVMTDRNLGIRYGTVGGESVSEKIFYSLVETPVTNASAKDYFKSMRDAFMGTVAEIHKKDVLFNSMVTAKKALDGELLQTNRERWTGDVKDSQGNIHRLKKTDKSMEFMGLKYTHQTIQIGKSKKVKGYLSYSPSPFFGFKAGRYAK